MKFLIYGAGVIGSIFAGKLIDAGYEVTMLARGARYDELRKRGLILRKAKSTLQKVIYPTIINELKTEDIYDYIMVVMQKTQVADILPILRINKSKNLVFVVNNASGYENLVNAVGKDRVMLGFPAAGGERESGVVSYFIMKGFLRLIQTTTFGEYNGQRTERLKILIESFNKAGITSVCSVNMDAWQKYHVAMITPIGNLLFRYDTDNYKASKNYKDVYICIKAIQEGFNVLQTLGYRITPWKSRIYLLPAVIVALFFKCILKTKFSEMVMAKHTRSAMNEIQYLQQEFDVLIRESQLITPNIDNLRIEKAVDQEHLI